MARKNHEETTVEETTEVAEISEAAAATRAAIGDRPRQSQVRLVSYYVTIRDAKPDLLEELFGGQIDELEAVSAVVVNPIQAAIEKATNDAVARAVHAMTNEDEKNGYANFQFDADVFALKTAEKAPRSKRTVVDKAKDLLAGASDEDLEMLKELLAQRNL